MYPPPAWDIHDRPLIRAQVTDAWPRSEEAGDQIICPPFRGFFLRSFVQGAQQQRFHHQEPEGARDSKSIPPYLDHPPWPIGRFALILVQTLMGLFPLSLRTFVSFSFLPGCARSGSFHYGLFRSCASHPGSRGSPVYPAPETGGLPLQSDRNRQARFSQSAGPARTCVAARMAHDPGPTGEVKRVVQGETAHPRLG